MAHWIASRDIAVAGKEVDIAATRVDIHLQLITFEPLPEKGGPPDIFAVRTLPQPFHQLTGLNVVENGLDDRQVDPFMAQSELQMAEGGIGEGNARGKEDAVFCIDTPIYGRGHSRGFTGWINRQFQ
jgi:hypothetical protein